VARRLLEAGANMRMAIIAATVLAGCIGAEEDPEVGNYEGVSYDQENPGGVVDDGKSDAPRYTIPTDLPQLESPEIIVSLEGLTAHLFDRTTGFSAVYPVGVGVIGSRGVSITPTGHFATGADIDDGWWYIVRRTVPDYFAGLPFLRLTARNSDGANTYALHGPITDELIRGYVSHGCVRMAYQNIIDLFWMVKPHASTPVTIQQEVELDGAGVPVDVGRDAVLWPVGEPIAYGASVGPRQP
jgi:lipoprotein-anchoring transpeptidase ErfK/SrfK